MVSKNPNADFSPCPAQPVGQPSETTLVCRLIGFDGFLFKRRGYGFDQSFGARPTAPLLRVRVPSHRQYGTGR